MARYNTNRPVWPQKCKFNWNSELSRRGAGGGRGGEGKICCNSSYDTKAEFNNCFIIHSK